MYNYTIVKVHKTICSKQESWEYAFSHVKTKEWFEDDSIPHRGSQKDITFVAMEMNIELNNIINSLL